MPTTRPTYSPGGGTIRDVLFNSRHLLIVKTARRSSDEKAGLRYRNDARSDLQRPDAHVAKLHNTGTILQGDRSIGKLSVLYVHNRVPWAAIS